MSYIHFIDLGVPTGQKTRRYSARALGGTELGQVRWYGAWRKFCFFPEGQTVLDDGCMDEIKDFCRHQNDERRKEINA